MKLKRTAWGTTLTLVVATMAGCGGKNESGGGGGSAQAPPPTKPPAVNVLSSKLPSGLKPGLKLVTFPNNKFSTPGETTSVAPKIGFSCEENPYKDKEVSLRYDGWLQIDKDGVYVFQVLSDDQSTLKLNNALVLDHQESTRTKEGWANLKAGGYPITFEYQNNVGPACLVVKWSSDNGVTFTDIPPELLQHE